MIEDDPKVRAASYGKANYIAIDFHNLLGSGQEGFVWKTDRDSAIKVFDRLENFERELECYQILKKYEVSELVGFTIPEMIGSDCDLRILEMSIVSPPYVLDFGKAYIGIPPDFSEEIVAAYEEEREEWFEGNWELVQSVVSALRRLGIHYWDARPSKH